MLGNTSYTFERLTSSVRPTTSPWRATTHRKIPSGCQSSIRKDEWARQVTRMPHSVGAPASIDGPGSGEPETVRITIPFGGGGPPAGACAKLRPYQWPEL